LDVTRLFMALYHRLAGAACTSSEREALVAARDSARAVRISHRDLHTVEARLRDEPWG
jgi:hypothetical protein